MASKIETIKEKKMKPKKRTENNEVITKNTIHIFILSFIDGFNFFEKRIFERKLLPNQFISFHLIFNSNKTLTTILFQEAKYTFKNRKL